MSTMTNDEKGGVPHPCLTREDIRADLKAEFQTFIAVLRQDLFEWASTIQPSELWALSTAHHMNSGQSLRDTADAVRAPQNINGIGLPELLNENGGCAMPYQGKQSFMQKSGLSAAVAAAAASDSEEDLAVAPPPPPQNTVAHPPRPPPIDPAPPPDPPGTMTYHSNGTDDSAKLPDTILDTTDAYGKSEQSESSRGPGNGGGASPVKSPERERSSSRVIGSHKQSMAKNATPKLKRLPSRLPGFQKKVLRLVNHNIFDMAVAITILLNGVVVGSQTDFMARNTRRDDEAPLVFEVLEYIFCVVFTVELGLRLYSYRLHFFSLSFPGWGWNYFDFFIVSMQLFEIVMTFAAKGLGFSFNLLRTLRLVRVLRLARTLRLVSELRTIVSSIAGSMKPLLWTGILLFMIVYVLSVYVTQVVLHKKIEMSDNNLQIPPDFGKYWGSLIPAMYTLFQTITGGVDWDTVVRPLVDNIGPEVGILFTLYIMFTVFAMLNVVTGVFIQNVIKNDSAERESNTMSHVQQLFKKIDVGHRNQVTWDEFESQLDTKAMREFFRTIDVDMENARDLFELLDVDDSGEVDAGEFVDGCLRIWAPTKGLDLRILGRDINKVKALVSQRGEDPYSPKAACSTSLHSPSAYTEDMQMQFSQRLS